MAERQFLNMNEELINKVKKMSEEELDVQSARGGEPNPQVFSAELTRRSVKYTKILLWLTVIVIILVLVQIAISVQ